MLRHDFPDKWFTQSGESIVVVITRLLSSNQGEKYLAGLHVTYRLAKIFEYKRQTDKGPFIQAMQQILPILYNLFNQLLPLPNQESCLLQKLILKIFYCLVQVKNLKMIVFNHFAILVLVESRYFHDRKLSRMVRDFYYNHQSRRSARSWSIRQRWEGSHCLLEVQEMGNEDYWPSFWAVSILLHFIFNCFCFSYGSKGHVEKTYETFAEYYTNNLASHAITSVMHILSQHAANTYVSERVLHLCISHLGKCCF